MNVNYGLFPVLDRDLLRPRTGPGGRRKKIPKREKNEKLAARALERLETYRAEIGLPVSGAT